MRAWRASMLMLLAGGCGFSIPTSNGSSIGDDAAGVDDGPSVSCKDTWYDLAWTTRARLDIAPAKVTGELTDFPVLVDVIARGAASEAEIVFTAGDGKTLLPHDLESYDTVSGRLLAWVKLPQLSATNPNRFYVYVGNAAAGKTDTRAKVWSAGFAGVWHMSGDPSGTAPQMLDASGHTLHGTVRGGVTFPTQIPGKIGGSINLDGVNDAIDAPSITIGASFTYEAWIRQTTNNTWKCIVNNNPGYDRWFGSYVDMLDFWDNNSEYRVPATIPLIEWSYVAATYDGSQLRLFRNGQPVGTPATRTFGVRTNPIQIGYTNSSMGEWFAGQLDEVRISSIARSPGFLETSYRDELEPSTFATVEPAETCP